ncbi:MAG: hypothetical protein H7833_03210 [Magnetococcus sp. DMHC-1]|nr:hypothetical protein [Magnetococcales bacterium]
METNIRGDAYAITYDEASRQVIIKGILRLNGLQEYAPVTELLSAASKAADSLIVDIKELEFLNSSGIAMLSKFVIEVRNRQTSALTIRGSQAVAWQKKSLTNLQKLMPALVLEIL